MNSSRTRGMELVLAALTRAPVSTSDLYDRVGYAALLKAGLIDYRQFRAALVAAELDGLAVSAKAEDESTLWSLPVGQDGEVTAAEG